MRDRFSAPRDPERIRRKKSRKNGIKGSVDEKLTSRRERARKHLLREKLDEIRLEELEDIAEPEEVSV